MGQFSMEISGHAGSVLSGNQHTVGANDPEDYVKWVVRAKQAYSDARRAIEEAQLETRNSNLFAAVQFMLENDQYFPHMIGDIRLACNALYRHFFTKARKKVG